MTKKSIRITGEAKIAAIERLMMDGYARVIVTNLGVFEAYDRKAFTTTNPATGERMDVPQVRCVSFRPSKIMKKRLTEHNSA